MKLEFPRTEPFPGVSLTDWQDWKWQFRNALRTLEAFEARFELLESERKALSRADSFPARATPYAVALCLNRGPEDPLRQLLIPRWDEFFSEGQQMADPLGERKHSPRERLVHRYPDRVLFLITDQCALYCRYCLRKHFTGQDQAFIGSHDYEAALNYIRNATGVREVILSGGDPLTLADNRLDRVLSDLRQIEHIELIRIASRVPVVCPMRITDDLVTMFRKHKPIFFMTHFNHPREVTWEAAEALEKLVDHGVPVLNQMVLLNGINNHPALVQALSRRLLYLRVKPYYMFQCDPSEGTEHFRTSIEDSMAIQRELWGRLSGLAVPNLSIDIPGGGGKVGVTPRFHLNELTASECRFRGWDGQEGIYRQPTGPMRTPMDLDDYLPEWEALKEQPYGKSR